MMQDTEDQRLTKQYLLGELDPEEQRRVEERLLTDDAYFEELLMAEDELTDEYLGGALSAHEQERFERHFLATPERHQKLRFARVLRKYIDGGRAAADSATTPVAAPPSSSWKRWLPSFLRTQRPAVVFSLAITLLISMLCGFWIIIQTRRARNQPLRAQSQRAAVEGELAELNSPQNQNPEIVSPFFVVSLTPGLARGSGEITKVAVPAAASLVQFRLDTPSDEYRSYWAVLQKDDDTEIFTIKDLTAEGAGSSKIVALKVPARLLTRGDYSLRLSGLPPDGKSEEIGKYLFRVLNR